MAAGARTHPLRCFAIRVLSSDSCRRRNIMLFRYRLVAVATLCSSDTVSWPVGADAQRANCEAPERAGADSAGNHVNILCDSSCKWYQENVLSYPKSSYYDVLFLENVLDRTNFMYQR